MKLPNPDQKKGYDFAEGFLLCVGRYFIIGWLIASAINLARNSLGWGLDDSDRNGWNRSGLTVHTDAKTGAEYLSDGKGGLARREK